MRTYTKGLIYASSLISKIHNLLHRDNSFVVFFNQT